MLFPFNSVQDVPVWGGAGENGAGKDGVREDATEQDNLENSQESG